MDIDTRMRCSDCKYFKTKECKVNPNAENFFSAENFACFELDANRQTSDREITASPQSAAPQMSAKPRGNEKKNTGILLSWVGIIGIVMGIGIAWGTFSSMPNMDTPEDFPIIIAGIIIGVVGWFIAIIGALLYSVGRSQEKRYKE
jgi:hypothetical protein